MRQNEILNGIEVKNEEGEIVGNQKLKFLEFV